MKTAFHQDFSVGLLRNYCQQARKTAELAELNRPDFRSVLQARMEHDEQEAAEQANAFLARSAKASRPTRRGASRSL
jgi:hypothetical protein